MATWAYSMSVAAATYGFPIVAMYLLRDSTSFGAKPKAAPNEIWRIKDIATPAIAAETGYVTPNVNVVYGFGFMDLGREPVIVTAPDSKGRYYLMPMLDAWIKVFASPGKRTTGTKAGYYAITGPGWAARERCPPA